MKFLLKGPTVRCHVSGRYGSLGITEDMSVSVNPNISRSAPVAKTNQRRLGH